MGKMRLAQFLVWGVVLILATHAAAAERQGWYGGLDLGVAIPETLDSRSRDNDIPTNCDPHLKGEDPIEVTDRVTDPENPKTVDVPFLLNSEQCTRGQDAWSNSFDLGPGILAGVTLGYAWHGFRFEAEYVHRAPSGDYSSQELTGGDKDKEFVEQTERISDFRGHHFFGNLYYDFHDVWPKVIPYVGAGVGLMHATMNYSAKFVRNNDRDLFQDRLGRNPNAAGTISSADADLSDTVLAYQVMAGLDYALSERLFVGLKARYADVGGAFHDSRPWDQLRSHPSTIASGGDVIRYQFETDALSFWGVSLNLKYFFQ